MEELLKQILERLNNIEETQKQIQSDIKDLKEGQSRIESKFDDLEAKNATRHTEMFVKLNEIGKDAKYIKYKIHENEEEIFDIKDHLKLIK